MSDFKLSTKLVGLTHNPRVAEVVLVRRTPLSQPRVRNVNPPPAWARNKALFELWRWHVLRRLTREQNFALAVGIYLLPHGLQALQAAASAGVPAVVSVIGDDIHIHAHRRLWRLPLHTALRRADGVTVMGPTSRRHAIAAGADPERIFTLQNFHDRDRFAPAAEIPAASWDVVYVGDLIPLKRVDAILRALASLTPALPALRGVIVGDGPERGRLERLCRTLGLGDRVHFAGRTARVEHYLRRARVMVMASRSEAVPAAAIEAMSCGLPVVLTRVGDVEEVFQHQDNAILVPWSDQAALEAALRGLLTDPAHYARLRAGALAAAERHAAAWDRDGQIRAWDQILGSLARPPGPAHRPGRNGEEIGSLELPPEARRAN